MAWSMLPPTGALTLRLLSAHITSGVGKKKRKNVKELMLLWSFSWSELLEQVQESKRSTRSLCSLSENASTCTNEHGFILCPAWMAIAWSIPCSQCSNLLFIHQSLFFQDHEIKSGRGKDQLVIKRFQLCLIKVCWPRSKALSWSVIGFETIWRKGN